MKREVEYGFAAIDPASNFCAAADATGCVVRFWHRNESPDAPGTAVCGVRVLYDGAPDQERDDLLGRLARQHGGELLNATVHLGESSAHPASHLDGIGLRWQAGIMPTPAEVGFLLHLAAATRTVHRGVRGFLGEPAHHTPDCEGPDHCDCPLADISGTALAHLTELLQQADRRPPTSARPQRAARRRLRAGRPPRRPLSS